MLEATIAVVVIAMFACGVLGAVIMQDKGLDGAIGLLLGVVLGVVGVAIALALDPSLQKQVERHQRIEAEIRKRSQREYEAMLKSNADVGTKEPRR